MTRSSGCEASSPRELQRVSKYYLQQAKKTAICILDNALSSHIMPLSESQNIVAAVGRALLLDDEELTKLKRKRVYSGTETAGNGSVKESTHKKRGKTHSIDDHDEICEVCNKGGDLLCCDTCTLVFHLKCIRPKLKAVPKGQWSCPHCVIDDLAGGDVCSAKNAIRSMRRLGRGIDSDDDSSFTGPGPSEGADPMRTSQIGDYSLARKGKKFVLRRMERKQLVDIGKYLSLEEALNYIKEETFNKQVEQEKKATISSTIKPSKGAEKLFTNSSTGSLTSLRRNKRGNFREENTADEEDALTTELDDGTGRSEVSGRSLRSAELKAEKAEGKSEDSSSNDYDELWCSHCMDDKSVLICAFCGCKKCFGKYDSNLLILCDHCERETHTYCLDPALSEVPTEDPWYCQSCLADGMSEAEGSRFESEGSICESAGAHKRRKGSADGASVGERSQISGEENDGQVSLYKKWGRGRKKAKTPEHTHDNFRNANGKCQGKTFQVSSAGVVANQQPRGRGRPPGSGKRLLPTTAGVFSAGVSMLETPSSSSAGKSCSNLSQSEPPAGSKGKLKRSASSTCSMGGEEDSRSGSHSGADVTTSNEDGSGSSGEGARMMSVDNSTHDAEESERGGDAKSPDEVFEPRVPGISAALAVISRAGVASDKVDGGPWTETELNILEQVRAWAPLQDIQRAHAALLAQKEILIKRIMLVDPLFDSKDLEALVSAQLTALSSAQQDSTILDNVNLASAGASQTGGAIVLGAATPAPSKPKRSKPKPKATPASASSSSSSAAPSGIAPATAKTAVTAAAGAALLPSVAPIAAAPSKKLSLANITSATILPAPTPSPQSHPSQECNPAAPVPLETATTAINSAPDPIASINS